jgi:hypothetical protein
MKVGTMEIMRLQSRETILTIKRPMTITGQTMNLTRTLRSKNKLKKQE